MREFVIVFLFALALTVSASAQSKNIQGAWRLTEITTTGPDGSTRQMSQPSIYLFTKKHYSIIYVASADARPVLDDYSKTSADELRNIFVDSFVANAGTYEMKGGKLTTRPMVAKLPSFMKSGTFVTVAAKMEGNMMTLTTEAGGNAPANPTTYKLTRIE